MKGFTWQQTGAVSATVLMTMSACQPLNIAQASSQPQTKIKGCHAESLLLPAHKDVEVLRQLQEQYLGQTPIEMDLGLSKAEFAQVLAQFVAQIEGLSDQSLSSTDAALLKRLQQDYATELRQVDQPRQEQNRQFGVSPRHARPTSLPPALTGAAETLGQSKVSNDKVGRAQPAPSIAAPAPKPRFQNPDRRPLPGTFNTEDYQHINENPFFVPQRTPLSTFSIDVDTASYSNVRRFIHQGQLPPKDAVRLEELVNYFDYDYAAPQGDQPFSVSTEVATAPWNGQHQLVHIGLKGKELAQEQPSNLVFLIDVSGSMQRPNKLALVKKSLCLLVHQLKPEDRVSLVVYAGQAGIVLPSTPGTQKATIMKAIDRLEAGGSTAGAAGIKMAYDMAERHFLKNGNNRVILATDGDFNVGQSSDAELERLIEQKRDRNIFLTVLGYGTGNYKDNKMELLADKGNGNYAYIDTLLEAQKVLVNDLRGTLFTIAKDVKIQVEFNPEKVQAYRLIGYENRLLRDQDFNDDQKDAGEIGSGHTVTALYEVIPTGVQSKVELPDIDPLQFQKPTTSNNSSDLMNLKLRYKQPTGRKSELMSRAIATHNRSIQAASDNFKFSAAVAMYGMMLRDSTHKGGTTFQQVLNLAAQAQGEDPQGYRHAFLQLVRRSQTLHQMSLNLPSRSEG